jgi:hypothetical protein
MVKSGILEGLAIPAPHLYPQYKPLILIKPQKVMVDNITNSKNSNIYMQKNTVIVNYLKIYKNTGQCRISLSDDVL